MGARGRRALAALLVPLGQFTTPTAIRANLNGLLHTPSLALWNVEKK
ncbi:hypothetical protein [Reyranella sp.]